MLYFMCLKKFKSGKILVYRLCFICSYPIEVCSPLIVGNGQLETNGKTWFKPSDQVSINCDNPYVPAYTTTTCQTNRSWSPQPSCTEVTCTVPALSNGQYHLNQNAVAIGTVVGYPSAITPSCSIGFEPIPNIQRSCQIDGRWSGQQPTCTEISCTSLPPMFDNGRYDAGGKMSPFDFDQAIMPVCNPGFYLDQGGERRCYGSNFWSGDIPGCFSITCKSPSEFNYGAYNGSQAIYPFGSVLTPTCDKGYNFLNGVHTRTCVEKDTWNGTSPLCQIVQCPDPQPGTYGTIINDNKTYGYGTSITLACNRGYESTTGIMNSTCLEDGTWSSILQCVPVICKDSRGVEHEAIPSYPFPAYGEIVSVEYNSTFFIILNGSLQVNCSDARRLAWIDKPYFGESCLTSKHKEHEQVYAIVFVP